jgi:4'-phosphopantetheinyl transferase
MDSGTWRDSPLLREGDVLVFRARGGGPDGLEREPRSWLSAPERERAEAFRADLDRSRFVRRTAFLRGLLGELLDLDPPALRFEVGGHGKPRLDPAQAAGLRFNLSHRSGEVLVAVSAREVGIDVEEIRELDDLERIAARVLHPTELAAYRGLSTEERLPAFFRAWTRKEAALKALGTGFAREPSTLVVGLEPWPSGKPRSTADPLVAEFGALADLPVTTGFLAAVCARGTGWRVRVIDR